ncbi:aminotransferase class V-fold PLP-dependent enzyme [Bradyrhizobium sp. HKCCYLR20261]|uniref:aminotransferase class V-fold PLP-dependent enzyme n=1 Tax=Bradyrhizobium sp. HKCCYLR20261 TaxID=3420760 RepID=UPI003EC1095B
MIGIKEAFALPEGVCYLNAAAIGPIPDVVQQAGIAGISSKRQPWIRDRAAARQMTDELRGLAAGLIGARSSDVAVITAVSYGIATVCAGHRPPPGSRFLVLAGEHTSLSLGLARHAEVHGCTLEIVGPTHGDDWTAALTAALLRPGAAPVSFAGLTPLHWTSGAVVDLSRIIPIIHAQGGVVLVDATQAAGIMPIDVTKLQPDWLVFPTYKWLLGPFHLAFLYVAPQHQEIQPLEQHVGTRQGPNPALVQDSSQLAFASGATRLDSGEPDTFAAIPMGLAALTFMTGWSAEAASAHVSSLTKIIAEGLKSLSLCTVEDRFRSPHILAVRGQSPFPESMVARLAAHNVHISVRHGLIRISPHVYNLDADAAQCLTALSYELSR